MVSEEVKSTLETKLKEITRYCRNNGIPITIAYALPNNGKAQYVQHLVSPLQAGVEISPDRITGMALALKNGFHVVPELRANDNTLTEDDLDFGDDDDENVSEDD